MMTEHPGHGDAMMTIICGRSGAAHAPTTEALDNAGSRTAKGKGRSLWPQHGHPNLTCTVHIPEAMHGRQWNSEQPNTGWNPR